VTFRQSRNIPWEHSAWSYTNVLYERFRRQDTVSFEQLQTDWRSFGACRPSDSIETKGLNRNIDESKFLQLVLCQWAWSSRETLHAPYFAPTRAMLLFFFSFFFSILIISLSTSLFRSRAKLFLDLSIERFLVNSHPRIIFILVVVVLGYSHHSRWNPPRPNDDVTLVHDSPCRTTFGFLFPFVQNEKRAKELARRKGGWRGTLGTDGVAMYTGARATVLNGIIAIKVVAFPRGPVYAPRHPTDAELMILINVS